MLHGILICIPFLNTATANLLNLSLIFVTKPSRCTWSSIVLIAPFEAAILFERGFLIQVIEQKSLNKNISHELQNINLFILKTG